MQYHQTFEAIAKEYDTSVALHACMIYGINCSKAVQSIPAFYDTPDLLILNHAKALLWELTSEEFTLAWSVYRCIYDWQTRQSLEGLGGCTTKTFKELVEANNSVV